MAKDNTYTATYENSFLGSHVHLIKKGESAQFHILNGGSRGYADYMAEKIITLLNIFEK